MSTNKIEAYQNNDSHHEGPKQEAATKSHKKIALPRIVHSQSLPNCHDHHKNKQFTLSGMYHAKLPSYNPKKDKNLKEFFDKPTVKKRLGIKPVFFENENEQADLNRKKSRLETENNEKKRGNTQALSSLYKHEKYTKSRQKIMKAIRTKTIAQGQQNNNTLGILGKQEFLSFLDQIRQKIKSTNV